MMERMSRQYDILIVDDERLIRESLFEIFRIEGYRAHMAGSGEEALELMRDQKIDIVLTDLKLPNIDGVKLLEEVKALSPETEVIVITGFGSIENAVEAVKKGAYDYITKPVNDDEIKATINKIIVHRDIVEENKRLRALLEVSTPKSCGQMIGSSPKMQKVYHIIESVADSNATILISGESGTGKGLVARAIHALDQKRKDKPFVEVSCGALSETLLESELFGHVKGAFTGAIRDKEGRFEFARGGTVFLDEIDAFSPMLQVKLLRVLQDGVFERVGDNITRKTDARIIVATNRLLTDLVRQGEFREDLYYRINVVSIMMPPLRERKEDIAMLIDHFFGIYTKKNGKKIANISSDVRQMFMEYHWPGNIRELQNAVEGAIIMAKGEIIQKGDVLNLGKFSDASDEHASLDGKSLKEVMERPERDTIIAALEGNNWNRNQAAATLGINRTTLYNKMKKYKISFRKGKSHDG
ncbi:MAG TPA: sigma-54 dependent transcriptional regulator [Candidatus Bathyarchaeia archaeon]|nr:sigma-54 dependent transcriptional regulator [Candidatus Bathyarchaeia archaeon]